MAFGYVNREREKMNAELLKTEVWDEFHENVTEMIVNGHGRHMFPTVEIKANGLNNTSLYLFHLEFRAIDRCRYKYCEKSSWVRSGPEELAEIDPAVYVHPAGVQSGEFWMSNPISFKGIKLTNTHLSPNGHVRLTTMHKYQPIINIYKLPEFADPSCDCNTLIKSIFFANTVFIAVTAYQNNNIRQLKINHNKFAKGFRKDGKATLRKQLKERSTSDNIEQRFVDDEGPAPKRRRNDSDCQTSLPTTSSLDRIQTLSSALLSEGASSSVSEHIALLSPEPPSLRSLPNQPLTSSTQTTFSPHSALRTPQATAPEFSFPITSLPFLATTPTLYGESNINNPFFYNPILYYNSYYYHYYTNYAYLWNMFTPAEQERFCSTKSFPDFMVETILKPQNRS